MYLSYNILLDSSADKLVFNIFNCINTNIEIANKFGSYQIVVYLVYLFIWFSMTISIKL